MRFPGVLSSAILVLILSAKKCWRFPWTMNLIILTCIIILFTGTWCIPVACLWILVFASEFLMPLEGRENFIRSGSNVFFNYEPFINLPSSQEPVKNLFNLREKGERFQNKVSNLNKEIKDLQEYYKNIGDEAKKKM
jgi:hypothetical protein